MFEVAETGEKLDKASFKAKTPAMREALLEAQVRLQQQADFSVVIVIAGAEGSGKGDAVNFLLEWLDVRGVETHAVGQPTERELARAPLYRFWRRLPPKGRIAIFLGSWYTHPIVARIENKITQVEFEHYLHQAVEFERMLSNEQTLVLKYWLHITKKQQKRRFEQLECDPHQAWRVTPRDWQYHKSYDRFREVATEALRQTGSGHASWEIIEAADWRFRNMALAEKVLRDVQHRLDAPALPAPKAESLPKPRPTNIINSLDLSQSLAKKDYRRQLLRLQGKLGQLSRHLLDAACSVAVVFEGADAAGKGGCIRRVAQSLDARFYRVIPIAAPSDEERARPYLWRFWRTVPWRGHFAIYDRSWYGRVLVERIEGYCHEADWKRAYAEINEFEQELVRYQTTVIKFWLAIDQPTQLARFRQREATGHKRYKITEEDWRNRDKWAAYEAAVCDMIEHTSTEFSPWTLVEANDKRYARIKVLKTMCERLEEALDRSPRSAAKRREQK